MFTQKFMATVGKKACVEYIRAGSSAYAIFWDCELNKWVSFKVK